jgi:hypothetical protein
MPWRTALLPATRTHPHHPCQPIHLQCQAKNCSACDGDARRCTTCDVGGWTLSTRQGQCYRCKVPRCDRCEDNNPHSCASCAERRENRGGICM